MLKNIKLFNPLVNTRGVGLVELMVSSVAIVTVTAFVLSAFIGQKSAQNLQAQISDAQQAATFSMVELTKAIRNAGYNVSASTPTYQIKIGSAGHDTLVTYVGTTSLNSDTIRFFVDHTGTFSGSSAHPALMKKLNSAVAQPFAEDIEDVDFIPVVGTTNSITLSITARTASIDKGLNDYRRRTVSSDILIPNAPTS